VVLELLNGLPLALAQAGSYMGVNNVSALTYAKHYNQTWKRLQEGQNRFPIEEYGDRSVLTTWTVSYEQIKKQSEEAAWLLKLWGFLDNGEAWYELIAADSKSFAERKMDVPEWLQTITADKLAFAETMGLLSRYSLADGTVGTESHSMHSVPHRWCRYLAEEKERYELGRLATFLVALSIPEEEEEEFWPKRKRIMAHGLCVSRWIERKTTSNKEQNVKISIQAPEIFAFGRLFDDEGKQRASRMYERALDGFEKGWRRYHVGTLGTLGTLNIISFLYLRLGRLEEAEQMCQRVLNGMEKALGRDHLLTLGTLDNLSILYVKLGRLEEAEQIIQRALNRMEKVLGRDHLLTLGTLNNLSILYVKLGRLEEAEQIIQRALNGMEKALGEDSLDYLNTLTNQIPLYIETGRLGESEQMLQRARDGYAKILDPDSLQTYFPALTNMGFFALLRLKQGRVDDARHWFSQALLGSEKTFGQHHKHCQHLRESLAWLESNSENLQPDSESSGYRVTQWMLCGVSLVKRILYR
jgi:tetratricopeptide (TPR) repeat protein